MDVDEALDMAETWQALPDANGAAHTLAAEVRALRTERDAALNLLEGYAPELTRRLRDQMAFERARATEGEP